MLEIQEKFDSAGYESVVAAAGVNNVHITEALDAGSPIGFIAYAYEAERTIVYDYDDGGDLLLCDGLVRSVMFKSVLKGIETMVFQLPDKTKYESLVKLLFGEKIVLGFRFLESGSDTCENLDGFMNACEHCNNK